MSERGTRQRSTNGESRKRPSNVQSKNGNPKGTAGKKKRRSEPPQKDNMARQLFPFGVLAIVLIIAYSVGLVGIISRLLISGLGLLLIYALIAIFIFKQPVEDLKETLTGGLASVFGATKGVAGGAYRKTQNMYDTMWSKDEYDDEVREYESYMNGEEFEEEEEEEYTEDMFDFGQEIDDEEEDQEEEVYMSNPRTVSQGSRQKINNGETVEVTKNTDTINSKDEVDFSMHKDRLVQSHTQKPMDIDSMTTVAIGENTELDIYGGEIFIEGTEDGAINIYTDTKPENFIQTPVTIRIQSGKEKLDVNLYGISRVQFRNVKAKSTKSIFSMTDLLSDDTFNDDDKTNDPTLQEELDWEVLAGANNQSMNMDDLFSDFDASAFNHPTEDLEQDMSTEDVDELLKSLDLEDEY